MKKLLHSDIVAGLLALVIFLVFLLVLAFLRRPVQSNSWHGVVDQTDVVERNTEHKLTGDISSWDTLVARKIVETKLTGDLAGWYTLVLGMWETDNQKMKLLGFTQEMIDSIKQTL